jgi:menaquinone-dependent protoporphyrinogen IX oxidase
LSESKKIVIYKSNTGFTEKYANWIAEDLHCDVVSLDRITILEIIKYDVIIFGGGIHAGKINGIKFIKDNTTAFENKKVIVFATGATPSIPEEIERFKNINLHENTNISFFYFQSGMNYTNMRYKDKMLMSLLKVFLKFKRDKSDIQQGAADAIKSSYDYSNRSQIEPLISFVNMNFSNRYTAR